MQVLNKFKTRSVQFFRNLKAIKIPSAIGKSRQEPSLGRSAGAKLIVKRLVGNKKPLLIIADRTRSLLSFYSGFC